MKLNIVVIRDSVAGVWAQPQFVTSLGGFVRGFGDECQKTDNNALASHPEDYEVFHVGQYDDSTCSFELFPQPVSIAHGSNYRKVVQ
jgi:hypothetical protein